jgi:GNAT superfamily N-acetyltransferase
MEEGDFNGISQMKIQELTVEDIPAAIDLVWEVFDEFEGPDYSPEGIAEFRQSINPESVSGMVERGEMRLWGCKVDGHLAGVIATRGAGHISLLFVRRENQRQGLARKLFETVVDECRKNNKVERITVNSSPYAVEVYHCLGFVDTDSEKTVNGIRFVPMEYVIPAR